MYLRVLRSLKELSGVLKFKVLREVKLVVKGKGDDRYHYQGTERQSYAIQERTFQKKDRKDNIIACSQSKEDNISPCYEPTNIAFTRESLFWRWRRVKEYYQELFEPDWDSTLKVVKSMR